MEPSANTYYHTAEDEKWKCCNFAVAPFEPGLILLAEGW
jgi:hypothetical protein